MTLILTIDSYVESVSIDRSNVYDLDGVYQGYLKSGVFPETSEWHEVSEDNKLANLSENDMAAAIDARNF